MIGCIHASSNRRMALRRRNGADAGRKAPTPGRRHRLRAGGTDAGQAGFARLLPKDSASFPPL